MNQGTDELQNIVSRLETIAIAAINLQTTPATAERIRLYIDQYSQMPDMGHPDLTDDVKEQLAKTIEFRVGVVIWEGDILTEQQNWTPWLDNSRISMEQFYWPRYRQYLSTQLSLSKSVVTNLDIESDKVLAALGDPTEELGWSRKGLVMGYVQSGKTSNYSSLMCKASDAGYKIIIVMAGVHNELRNQTQRRIDESFVGVDSTTQINERKSVKVGVGAIDLGRRPTTFTTAQKDFTGNTATAVGMSLENQPDPCVFVIKKNASTLKNLIQWLKNTKVGGSEKIYSPMLLIDDEADNASINTQYKKDKVTKINGLIRELRSLFEKSAFVGYSATPFANIFIDPDVGENDYEDLFPSDFIVSLNAPSNYLGPEEMFLENPDQYVRHIDDNDPVLPLKHPKDFTLSHIPLSLDYAIRVFLVSRAIRMLRNDGPLHSSMLVNASIYTVVHEQLKSEIHNRLQDIKNSIQLYSGLAVVDALKNQELRGLFEVWEEEYKDAGVDWEDIQSIFPKAVIPVVVKSINAPSPDRLDYAAHSATGLGVIAVGGYSLSRGLTLEGLTVSYFLRNSKAYDTIMQMGRWFGYRDGYQDLCRIWMKEESVGDFQEISGAIVELRNEFKDMVSAGGSPKDFGLKVRLHPARLMITAANKIGAGKETTVEVGALRVIQTHRLLGQPEAIAHNGKVFAKLVNELRRRTTFPDDVETGLGYRGYLIKRVPVGPIVDFVESFRNHEESTYTNGKLVSDYITDRAESELSLWDVLIPTLQSGENTELDQSLGIGIVAHTRTLGKKSDANNIYIGEKQAYADPSWLKGGMSEEEIERARAKYSVANPEASQVPPTGIAANRARPLLILNLLKLEKASQTQVGTHKLVMPAWIMSFPKTKQTKPVIYVITKVAIQQTLMDFDDEEGSGDTYAE